MIENIDVDAYKARQRAKLRAKRAKVVTNIQTKPWTDAEDAIAADAELFLVEKMARLQRSDRDIQNRMAAIVYGVNTVCENCGTSFMSPVKRGASRKCCSIACRHQASRSLIPIVCASCQKIFMPQNSGVRYCSKGCVAKAKQLPPIACGNCQQMFTRLLSRVKYCSKECRFEMRRTLTPIACGYCEEVFRPRTAAEKFCSRTCTGHAKSAKHVAEHSRACPVCGYIFVASVTGPRGERAIHCSRDCQVKAVAVPRVACVICQTNFPRHLSQKTCSRKCGLAYRIARQEKYRERWRRPCPHCGESFIANAISSHNDVMKRRKFCSKNCATKGSARWARDDRQQQPGTGVQVQVTERASNA